MDRVERRGRRDVKMQTTFCWSLSRGCSRVAVVLNTVVSSRFGPVRRFLNAYNNYPEKKHVRP